MARYFLLTVLLLAAVLLDSLLGGAFAFLGGRPNFTLVVVLAWAMVRGPGEGATAGFIGGLLLDSTSITPFGVNGALLGIIGYTVGLPEANVYRGNFPFFLAVGAVASLAYHALAFLVLQALGNAMPPVVLPAREAGIDTAINLVVLFPALALCRRLSVALQHRPQVQV